MSGILGQRADKDQYGAPVGQLGHGSMYSGGMAGGLGMTNLAAGMQGLSVHPGLTHTVPSSQFMPRGTTTPTFVNMGSMPQMGAGTLPVTVSRGGIFPMSQPSSRTLPPSTVLPSNKIQSRPTTLPTAIGSSLPLRSFSVGQSHGMMTPVSGFGAMDAGQRGLELPDFPVIGSRPKDLTPGASILPYRAAPGYGQALKHPDGTASEFQIDNEEFPALPGTSTKSTSEVSEVGAAADRRLPMSVASMALPEARAVLSYDLAPGANKERSVTTPIGPPKGVQKKAMQHSAITVPPGMVQDQFGMMGLLTFIRAAETDPNLVALALGSDLTTLGLNLNSPESLYNTFSSPWADSPCRPQDIDYNVPQEYLIHPVIKDKLAAIQLKRYGEDLLFYLYYNNGGDLLQLLASIELYNRDWRYHKEEKVWITRAPGIEPSVKTPNYEKGTYYFFDMVQWRKTLKELLIEYDRLEEKPQLPATLGVHHSAAVGTPTAATV